MNNSHATRLEFDQIPLPQSKTDSDSVAIVGFSARLPGCDSLNDFLHILLEQKDVIGQTPSQRQDYMQVQRGAFIQGVDEFDSSFFNIPSFEAKVMDPQQRLLLQEVWRALDMAGMDLQHLQGSATGVYVGASNFDYSKLLARSGVNNAYLPLSTSHSLLANRISYVFDLCGPSETIDTACSSSLCALDKAVSAIKQGEIDQAIVCGVNLLLDDDFFNGFNQLGMLSTQCKPFDSKADGYIRGEGIIVVILQSQKLAKAENHAIYAKILATGVNHSGKSDTLTSPSLKAQNQLYERIYSKVDIQRVSYLEMHATGMTNHDQVEVLGWQQFIRNLPVHIKFGSVKGNIGHLESASGLAGLIKILMMFQAKVLPGQAHLNEMHPSLKLLDSKLQICQKTEPWHQTEEPFVAALSSFGFGGVNAHAVIEQGSAFFDNKTLPLPKSPFLRKKIWFKTRQNDLLFIEESQGKLIAAKSLDENEFLEDRGIYLILGGISKFSAEFALYLIECFKTKIIILGRNTPNEHDKAFMDANEDMIEFIKADILDETQCDLLLKYLGVKYQTIDGLFDLEFESSPEKMYGFKLMKARLQLKSAVIFTEHANFDNLIKIPELRMKHIHWGLWQDNIPMGYEKAWEAIILGLNSQFNHFFIQHLTSSIISEVAHKENLPAEVSPTIQSIQPKDLSKYLTMLVFLNSWQFQWIKSMFASIESKPPIYYVFVDDRIQFEESINSLTEQLTPIIYYFSAMNEGRSPRALRAEEAEASLMNLINRLKPFSQITLHLYNMEVSNNRNTLYFTTLVQSLKKDYPQWMIECMDLATDADLSMAPKAIRSSQDMDDLLFFSQVLDELEHFSYHLIKYKLVSQGFIWTETNPSFIPSPSPHADYFRDYISLLKIFEKKHYAIANKNQIKTWDNLLQQRLELCKKYPMLMPFLNLLAVCADQLIAVLRSLKTMHEVLYPYGQDLLVKALYQHRPLMNFFNSKIASIVENFKDIVHRPLHVLELGGGCGSTTQAVLTRCNQIISYTFSDINSDVVSNALETFGHYPGFQAIEMDINKPIFERSVDVIIATDVLYQARILRPSVIGICSLLKTDGLHILTEITKNSLFFASSFGLSAPKEAFKDECRISGSALIHPESLSHMLEALGFKVYCYPNTEKLHQSLILATRNASFAKIWSFE